MPHSDLHPIKLHLSHAQIAKLRNGHTARLKHEHIGVGRPMHLHHHHLLKIHKAHRSGKGVIIGPLTHAEMHGSSLWDSIKSGFNYVKNNPTLNKIAGTVLDYGTNALLPSYSEDINKARRATLGVGLRRKHKMKGGHLLGHEGDQFHSEHMSHGNRGTHGGRLAKLPLSAVNMPYDYADVQGPLLPLQHPARRSTLPYVPNEVDDVNEHDGYGLHHRMHKMHIGRKRGRKPRMGGSFAPAGY